MPKGIVFELCLLNSDLVVQSRQRLRVTLSSGPEICAETNWLSIQKKLQEFCKERLVQLQGPVQQWISAGGVV